MFKLCKDIDEWVSEFLNLPLTGVWPYIGLNATYLKVRHGGRIVPVAAISALAANTEGRREILGPGIGPSDTETFWTEFLRSLRARGFSGVWLMISDGSVFGYVDPEECIPARHPLRKIRYHRRSRAEIKMHCEKLPGQRLSARDFDRQIAEFQVRVAVLNGFTALGTPITEIAP